MSSRTDIERLVYQYAECVDGGDFEGVARLFADGRMTGPDGTVLAAGYDAMLAFYKDTVRLYAESGTPLTQHVMSNLFVDVDEKLGEARGRCNYTVFQKTDDAPLQPIIAGSYRDRFGRSNSGWHFVERQTLPSLFGDLSRHLLRLANRH